MNATIDALGHRLEILMCDVHFRSDYDPAIDSPKHFLAIGEHNLREFEKVEAMDEECQERILNIISNMLASVLQKEAMEQYGNTNGESIKKVLYGWHNQPENQAYWGNILRCAEQSLADLNLTEEQSNGLSKLFDMLPATIIETLEELTSPLRLFPRAEAHSIAIGLSDMMMKEVGDANSARDNRLYKEEPTETG